MKATYPVIPPTALFLAFLLVATGCHAFQSHLVPSRPCPRGTRESIPTSKPTALHVVTDRDPDLVEIMLGGERYEMVSLPDSMCDTTVFVGNICEFVHDEDLSQLFQSVSVLQSVPACVVRKANMQSLRYGFVSFPTIEEKEAAILRFHRSEWRGKMIKVEPIRDNPKCGRVQVPERMVTYVSGRLKKTKNGINSLRSARGDDERQLKKKKKLKKARHKKKAILNPQHQATTSARYVGRLSSADQAELARAHRKGFVTLDGRSAGHRSLASLCSSHALKSSKLAVAHRAWCDELEKPNIILYKASGRGKEVLDHLVVDLSPLRDRISEYSWKEDILEAAATADMILRATEDVEECAADGEETGLMDNVRGSHAISDSSGKAIHQLPFVSLGFFVGERSNAKSMAKQLAQMWEVPEVEVFDEELDSDIGYRKSRSGSNKRYKNTHGKIGKDRHNSQEHRRAKRRRFRREDWEHGMGQYLRY